MKASIQVSYYGYMVRLFKVVTHPKYTSHIKKYNKGKRTV